MSSEPSSSVSPDSSLSPDNSLSAEGDCETPLAGEATTVPKSFLDRLCRELLEQFSHREAVADAVTESSENNEDDSGGGNDYDSNPSEFARFQHVTKDTSHCGDAAIDSRDVPEPLFVPGGRMDQHSNNMDDTLVGNEGDANLPAPCEADLWHNTSYYGDSTLDDENDSHHFPMELPQVPAERNSSDSEMHVDDSTSSQDGTSQSSIDEGAITTKKEEFRVRTSWKRWFLYRTTSDARPSNEPDGIDRAVRRLKCPVAAHVEDHMDEYIRWVRDVKDTGRIYGGFKCMKDEEQPVLSTYSPTVLQFLKDTSWIGDLRSLMHVLEDPSHDGKNYVMLADHSFILFHIRPIYNEWASEPPDLPPYKILTRFGSEDACFAIEEVTHFYDSATSNFDKLARAWSYYKYGIIWLQRYRISAEYTIALVLAARTLLEANRKRLLKVDESWEPEIARKSGFKKLLPVYNAETSLHEMPKNVGKKQEKRLAKMVKAVEEENKQRTTLAFEARKLRLILAAIEKLFRGMHTHAEQTLDTVVRIAKLQALRHETMREQYQFQAGIVGGAQLERLTAFETKVPHEAIMQIFNEISQIVGRYERKVGGVVDAKDKDDTEGCVEHLTYFNVCGCKNAQGGEPCAECETVRKAARLFGCGVCRELWEVNA